MSYGKGDLTDEFGGSSSHNSYQNDVQQNDFPRLTRVVSSNIQKISQNCKLYFIGFIHLNIFFLLTTGPAASVLCYINDWCYSTHGYFLNVRSCPHVVRPASFILFDEKKKSLSPLHYCLLTFFVLLANEVSRLVDELGSASDSSDLRDKL